MSEDTTMDRVMRKIEKANEHIIVSFDNKHGIKARDLIRILRRVANRDRYIRFHIQNEDDASVHRVPESDDELDEHD